MIRYLSILFFLLTFHATVNAQQLIVNKTLCIGGSTCVTRCNDANPTKDGGVIFTGSSTCNNTGDIPPTTYLNENVIVGKINSNLQLQWVKVFGGTADDYGRSVVETKDGGFAIAASTHSTDGDVIGMHGTVDYWLIRLDANGSKLWAKAYGGPYDDAPVSIAETADSGFIIIGASNGAGDDVPFHYTSSQFLTDWFVIKVDKNGNKQWAKTLGGTDNEYFNGNILVTNNGYFLASSSKSTDYDCTDTQWHTGKNTNYDFYLLKLDTAGNVIWNKSYGGIDGDYLMKAILNEADSSIAMVGYTKSSNSYMVPTTHGYEDMLIVNTDKNGNLIWAKNYGGIKDETYQTISANSQNGYFAYTNTESGGVGNTDSWLFITDNNGDIITSKVVGGSEYEAVTGAFEWNGKILLIGSTTSTKFTDGVTINKKGVTQEIYITQLYYFPTDILPAFRNKLLKIYPNPTTDFFTIEIPENVSGRLTIYNTTGKVITSIATPKQANNININTSDWPFGVYEVVWNSEQGKVYISKLIKE